MRPKKIVLCVDDNEQVLSQRCFVLETHGYATLRAATPEVALGMVAAAAAYGPKSIALLLTDLAMPRMDGNELARLVKRMRPSLPVMMVCGAVGAGINATAIVDVFLTKDAGNAELLQRVKILCARKRGPRKAASGPLFYIQDAPAGEGELPAAWPHEIPEDREWAKVRASGNIGHKEFLIGLLTELHIRERQLRAALDENRELSRKSTWLGDKRALKHWQDRAELAERTLQQKEERIAELTHADD